MAPEELHINATLQISKPVAEVFEAIVNPLKMSNYFIEKGSARMEEGQEIIWYFPEFEDACPIVVKGISINKYISFQWEGIIGEKMLVEINLEENGNSTIVRVSEKGMPNNEAGIKWLKGNTEGWANFLACLKAYLEYNINLRKGGFDFLKK